MRNRGLKRCAPCSKACSPPATALRSITADISANIHQRPAVPKNHSDRGMHSPLITTAPNSPVKRLQRLTTTAMRESRVGLEAVCATSLTALWRRPKSVSVPVVSVVVVSIPKRPTPSADSHKATNLVLMMVQSTVKTASP